jgi:hypothetical protein
VEAKFVRFVAPMLDRERAAAQFAAALTAFERPAAFIREMSQLA